MCLAKAIKFRQKTKWKVFGLAFIEPLKVQFDVWFSEVCLLSQRASTAIDLLADAFWQ